MSGEGHNNVLIVNYSLVRKTHKWTHKWLYSFTLYVKVNPGKLRFMPRFNLDIVEKTIETARAANTPQIYNVPLKLVAIFKVDTSNREKIKPTIEICCLYKKESKKGVKVSVQALYKPSWVMSSTFFRKVSFQAFFQTLFYEP